MPRFCQRGGVESLDLLRQRNLHKQVEDNPLDALALKIIAHHDRPNYLQSTTVDIGLTGYDECFSNGRIDALRAVTHDTTALDDPTAPFCPEYSE